MSRSSREAELRLLVESEAGRKELHTLFQQAIRLPVGELPAGGLMGDLMINTILEHEFPDEAGESK